MQGFSINRLEPADFRRAFPLVQLSHKTLTIGQWTTFAERITDTNEGSHRGILAARNNEGVICGVLTYEVRCDIEGCCQLGAGNLMDCGFFEEQSVQLAAAMIKTLDQIASELGCQRILIVVPEGSDPATIGKLASILEASGHRLTNATFSKTIEHAQGKR